MDTTGSITTRRAPLASPDYDGRNYGGGCDDSTKYGEWHVHVRSDVDEIVVYAANYCANDWHYLGRTGHRNDSWTWRWWLTNPSPRRVDRAVTACWRWCDRQNARRAAIAAAVEEANSHAV